MSNISFKENYHGIITHDGWIKVAKFSITAKILCIQGNKIQVKGKKKGSLICNVHKELLKDLKYLSKNDLVGIKWNMGKPYVVAYRKSNAKDLEMNPTGDYPISENMNWIDFFRRIDTE